MQQRNFIDKLYHRSTVTNTYLTKQINNTHYSQNCVELSLKWNTLQVTKQAPIFFKKQTYSLYSIKPQWNRTRNQ